MADDLKGRFDAIFDEQDRTDAAARDRVAKSDAKRAEQDREWEQLVAVLIEPALGEFVALLGARNVKASVAKANDAHHDDISLRIEAGDRWHKSAVVKFVRVSDTVKIDTEPMLGSKAAIPTEWIRGRQFSDLDRERIEVTVLAVVEAAIGGSR